MRQTAKNSAPQADILVGKMVMNQINKEMFTLQDCPKCKGGKKIREEYKTSGMKVS